MKRLLTLVKVIALVALAIAGVEGFLFIRVWQQDPRPGHVVARWTSNDTRLGTPATLHVEMKLPWHHRPASAQAQRLPSGWVTQENGQWTEGALDPTGFRQWSLETALVPVEISPAPGGVIAWPLRAVSGKPPRPVEIAVPSLPVIVPTDLADKPRNSNIPLIYHPPEIASLAATPAPTARPWIWVAVAAVVVIAVGLGRRLTKVRVTHEEPPWTRALANLTRLSEAPLGEAQAYCTRLSDILKEYSTQRFECNLVGASSTEFLHELARRHPLAEEDKQALRATLGHADLVRFAGAELARDSANAAVEHARRFVINTTPTPESDRA